MPAADANPARAGFDWRAFATVIREAVHADGRGYRRIAPAIGVTISDMSRAIGGANVDAGKVIALCDFAGVEIRAFYLPPVRNRDPRPDAKANEIKAFHHDARETQVVSASDCAPRVPCIGDR